MKKPEERRKFTRYTLELPIAYNIEGEDTLYKSITQNISSLGIRFVSQKQLREGSTVDLKLVLPKAPNPVHAQGKLVWVKKATLEDNSPYDVGMEFMKIEEDNKNTFLRFMCDLAYKYGHK
jgi:c-di-GMP-binding flagellar brake protein YcgR